jgi:hypothetical protein
MPRGSGRGRAWNGPVDEVLGFHSRLRAFRRRPCRSSTRRQAYRAFARSCEPPRRRGAALGPPPRRTTAVVVSSEPPWTLLHQRRAKPGTRAVHGLFVIAHPKPAAALPPRRATAARARVVPPASSRTAHHLLGASYGFRPFSADNSPRNLAAPPAPRRLALPRFPAGLRLFVWCLLAVGTCRRRHTP